MHKDEEAEEAEDGGHIPMVALALCAIKFLFFEQVKTGKLDTTIQTACPQERFALIAHL
jgi:hypothetical protein